ncbi:hypothetical protein Bca52824_080439 [Brassica carinata]|uniref:GH3 C-terminal domain-containing protein n=1 Tax=Brassica carinata TaxID=52824 RepID=A0A8X7PG24_BRACI|nr:hypothetical protein Bca52824_080439 [Brassica carinata]
MGALEIRVVQQGTFDSLMEYFISKGTSISQFKIHVCTNSPQALAILEDKVIDRFFSANALRYGLLETTEPY